MQLKRRAFKTVPVDIAPLIDVVFQLLIFFMLTSSFVLHPGIRVTLPKAKTATRTSASVILVTLTKEHVIYWNDEVVTLKELRRLLRGARAKKPVLIRADRYAYVDKLIQIWDLCRDSGYQQVHIATLTE